jgi:hypothetical protein
VAARIFASFLCFALGCGGCGRTRQSESEHVVDRSETHIAAPQGTNAPPPLGSTASTPTRDPGDVAFARELVGSSLGSLLEAFMKRPGINERFQKLIGADRVTVNNCTEFRPSERLGNTVVAQACRPHMCGYNVIVVVDLAAGTLHCGIKTEDRVTVYSEDSQNLPAPLVAWRKDPASWTSRKR